MNERGCEAVGIDLGTTYSSLAFMDSQLIPRIVPDSSGKAVIPSAVFFEDKDPIVGDIALQNARVRSDRVVQFVKVHMGDEWRFAVDGQVHTPETISALILAHLVREAEPQLGSIPSAVITVPAYFTEKRRRATQQAGEIAGLTVIGTLNEPMAAALAYGLHREGKEQTVMVYDLGGGTFDVTIVHITPDALEELAICGNRKLGGNDWDQCLIDLVVGDFRKKHGVDVRSNAPEALQALQDLQLACEQAKRQLSQRAKALIRVHALGHDHSLEVTRQQFEKATAHLLNATKLTMEVALDDAGMRWNQIDRVVLVGGSTLMPMVRQMLQEATGKPPDTGINPVTAVALGAAVYAHVVETGKGVKTVRLKDQGAQVTQTTDGATETQSAAVVPAVRFATAHGVGIRATHQGKEVNVVLIPKNTRVPVAAGRRFRTRRPAKGRTTAIKIVVTQGDTPDVELAEILGHARFSGIPPDEPSGQPVDIALQFDEQGRLHLRADYVNTGQELQLTLDVPGGLREEEVQAYRRRMIETGMVPRSLLEAVDKQDEDDDEVPLLEPLP